MADNRARMLTLAKVLIAAAWADGEISDDEKNCLKDIIFHLSDTGVQLSGQEWIMLEMYMDAPIEEAERARLVAELEDAIRTSAERQFVLEALKQMAWADGEPDGDEKRIIAEIEDAVKNTEVGLADSLNRLLGGAMNRRSKALAKAPNREAFYDDFVKNKVYYEVNRLLRQEGKSLDLPDEEMRRLGLAGGLMARIANVDREVTEAEIAQMASGIERYWGLSAENARFVAQVAVASLDVNYDYYRMTRQFATLTTVEERRRFLVALFRLAAVDGQVSFEETEEIRSVYRGINLTHQDFINAKLEAQNA